MSNHPNRNWRRRWRVDLATSTAIHESGARVAFTPDPTDPGAWDGKCVALPLPESGLDVGRVARLMREAGDIFAEALKK